MMKKFSWIFLIALVGTPSINWADSIFTPNTKSESPLPPSPTASATAVPTIKTKISPQIPQNSNTVVASAATATPDAKNELHLSGKLGFGTGFIPFNNYSFTLNTLSARLWLSEKFCLDLEGTYNGYSNSGTDLNGNAVQDPNQTYGIGLGFKYNVKEPVKNLFIQLIGQASYAANIYRSSQTYEIDNYNNQTWGSFVGIGFEYFIPFFDSLSVESNVGYSMDFYNSTTTSQYSYGGPEVITTKNTYGSSTLVNGLTINTLIIHFYF
jgi:hypothetical protein